MDARVVPPFSVVYNARSPMGGKTALFPAAALLAVLTRPTGTSILCHGVLYRYALSPVPPAGQAYYGPQQHGRRCP